MPTAWQLSLLPASFRGVPFGVRSTGWRTGRRAVTHEFPFRDLPYTEDLGRSARRLAFSGFVVGDDAGQQAGRLLNACEQKGAGELVHPIYGNVKQQLLSVETEERWDNGRVIEFRFQFVEPGEVFYPTTATDTQAVTAFQSDSAEPRIVSDYRTTSESVGDGSQGATAPAAPEATGNAPFEIPSLDVEHPPPT